jgi:hypothetical protein
MSSSSLLGKLYIAGNSLFPIKTVRALIHWFLGGLWRACKLVAAPGGPGVRLGRAAGFKVESSLFGLEDTAVQFEELMA